jgi:preprotein translocase subunit SecG
LIQPGKSGGLGAALGGAGATQIFGGRGAGNFLTRTTWIAASVFFLTSVTLAYLSTSTGDSLEDLANRPAVEPAPAPTEAPAPAAPAPAAASANDAPAMPAPASTNEAPSNEAPAPTDETRPVQQP